MACTEVDLYKSIKRCAGAIIMPGMRPKVYWILKSNIVKWPTLADTVTADMSELATYKGDFTLVAEKKWNRLDLTDQKSNFTSETQGEPPCATALNKASFIVGGTDADISGFARAAVNDPLIFLVEEREGQFRVIGNEMYDAVTKVSQDSGTAVSDKKQSTVTVECTDKCPAPFYVGKIVTADDGDLDGATGEAAATA